MDQTSAPTGFIDNLRPPAAEVSRLLERLFAVLGNPRTEQRKSPRVAYPLADPIGVEAKHPGGTTIRVLACCYDISEGGLGLVTGTFFHPGTRLVISVKAREGTWFRIEGTIAWCAHCEGRFHAAGVRLLERIDVRQFVSKEDYAESVGRYAKTRPFKLSGRVVVVCDQPLHVEVLSASLAATDASVVFTSELRHAVDETKVARVEAVIVDLNLAYTRGEAVIDAMRAEGFFGPIVAIAAEGEDDRAAKLRCQPSIDVLMLPIEPVELQQSLAALVAGAGGESNSPIHTTLDASSPLHASLERFVKTAKSEAGKLRAAMATGDMALVRSLCQALRASSKPFGFAPITEAAQRALQAIDASGSLVEADPALRQLCTRVSLMTLETIRSDSEAA